MFLNASDTVFIDGGANDMGDLVAELRVCGRLASNPGFAPLGRQLRLPATGPGGLDYTEWRSRCVIGTAHKDRACRANDAVAAVSAQNVAESDHSPDGRLNRTPRAPAKTSALISGTADMAYTSSV